MAKIRMDDYGITRCDCGAELVCNANGDMPKRCPACKKELDYSDMERS